MNKKSAHFKKVGKKELERNKRDGSVACKNYKQTKKAHREAYEDWE